VWHSRSSAVRIAATQPPPIMSDLAKADSLKRRPRDYLRSPDWNDELGKYESEGELIVRSSAAAKPDRLQWNTTAAPHLRHSLQASQQQARSQEQHEKATSQALLAQHLRSPRMVSSAIAPSRLLHPP